MYRQRPWAVRGHLDLSPKQTKTKIKVKKVKKKKDPKETKIFLKMGDKNDKEKIQTHKKQTQIYPDSTFLSGCELTWAF